MSTMLRVIFVFVLLGHSQGAGVSSLIQTAPAALSLNSQSSASSMTAQTLKALDTDGSGAVDRAEIESFAKSQGLSADEVAAEFKELDKNGNGVLDAEEIQGTLQEAPSQTMGGTQATTAAVPVQPVQLNALQPTRAMAMQVSESGSELESSVKLLEKDASLQASRSIAQELARRAAAILEQRNKDLKHAEELEKVGDVLRQNATTLARQAALLTEKAASDAAANTTRTAVSEVKRLEALANETEKKAFMKRQEAKQAMDSAMQAQADMSASVQRLRSSSL